MQTQNIKQRSQLLDRKWEKFRGGPVGTGGGSNHPRVTINRKGLIYLNAAAYEALGSPASVALYYNRDLDTIAVQPAFERSNEHFPVTEKQMGRGIAAAPFCRHYRIRVPTTERFLSPKITPEGLLLLNLKETVTVGGIDRKKGRQMPDG